jgi:survival of motor neuron-related-splicing factor 30
MKHKVSKWNNFNDKSKSVSKGSFVVKKNQESIFKTSEGLHSKVGVTGSGKGMTAIKLPDRYTNEVRVNLEKMDQLEV